MPNSVRGRIDRVTYRNEENLYTVLRLRDDEDRQLTVVGHFPSFSPGEEVVFEGDWVLHPEYGRQFKADTCDSVRPSTVEGIEKYLSSGLIKGIGPVTAKKIVDHFGAEALEVIMAEPDRLKEVPGIGSSKAGKIAEALRSQAGVREVMVFLQGHGVSPGLAAKIFKAYGEESIGKVTASPYTLADEIFGIGFKTADRIARSLGMSDDSPERVQAGLSYLLKEYAQDGHMFVPFPLLESEASRVMSVESDMVRTAIRAAAEAGQLVIDQIIEEIKRKGE
jgi:exodeoxyribonuclease V alpha subunit